MGQWLAQRIGKEYVEQQIPFHFMLTRAKGKKSWDGVLSHFFLYSDSCIFLCTIYIF